MRAEDLFIALAVLVVVDASIFLVWGIVKLAIRIHDGKVPQ